MRYPHPPAESRGPLPRPNESGIPDLPEGVSDLLDPLLSQYAESRHRWPLWTYDRSAGPTDPRGELSDYHTDPPEPDQRVTWCGSNAWADRLSWSALHLLQKLEAEIAARVEERNQDRVVELLHWDPGSGKVFVGVAEPAQEIESEHSAPTRRLMRALAAGREEEIADEHEADVVFAIKEIKLPRSLAAHTLASLIQLAPEIPESATEFRLPGAIHYKGLDHADFEELAHELIDALMAPYVPRGSLHILDDTVENFDESWEWEYLHAKGAAPGSSLLAHILAQGSPQGKDSWSYRGGGGVILLERAGLLPNLQGGRHYVLSPQRLLQLTYAEAPEIVEQVRAWEPDEAMLEQLIAFKEEEAQDPIDVATAVEFARRLRQDSRILNRAVCLRFPFLTFDEVMHLRTSDSSPKRAARWLVMHRSPAWNPSEDDASFQATLSKARNTG